MVNMTIKSRGNIPKKFKLIGNFMMIGALAIGIPTACSDAQAMEVPAIIEEESTLPEEIQILIRDYEELEDMEKDTSAVQQEIHTREESLKTEVRTFLEQLFETEKVETARKEIDEEIEITDPDWPQKIGLEIIDGISSYPYQKKTIYQLDTEEETLETLIRFASSKKTYSREELGKVVESYEQAKEISYGYRMAYLTCIDEKSNPEVNMETTVYTGTIFNNTAYSKRTKDLLDKTLLKVKTDYVTRTQSTYEPEEYIIKKVDGHWLIIHKKTGATDLLGEEEAKLCGAVGQVQLCYHEDGVLANTKKTDFQIEMLQNVLNEYLQKEEEKAK